MPAFARPSWPTALSGSRRGLRPIECRCASPWSKPAATFRISRPSCCLRLIRRRPATLLFWSALQNSSFGRAAVFVFTSLGRHLDGCRIGFDLGGSDRKVAAVIDGKVVFNDETVWDPYFQPDSQYHFDGIMDSLKKAA